MRWLSAALVLLIHELGDASTGSGHSPDDLDRGLDCLRKTTPHVQLSYPNDAFEHFKEIHLRMVKYTAPLHMHKVQDHREVPVPGIENTWIQDSLQRLQWGGPWHGQAGLKNNWIAFAMQDSKGPKVKLREVFGPFIPLLLTWTDTWVSKKGVWHYPAGFIEDLTAVLRPGVPYVTVSQNDEGITGKCELLMKDWPNILVFSSGGYGHVPVPLYHAAEDPPEPRKPFSERKYLVSFVGSVGTAPHRLRYRIADAVTAQSQRLGFQTFFGKADETWRGIMRDSVASLVPRGFGRTAFKLVETLQHGLIPIYVYSDVPWIAYPSLFADFGYITNLTSLEWAITELHDLVRHKRWDELERREALAHNHSHTHCSRQAISDQVFQFLQGGRTDLVCSVLPESRTDNAPCLGIDKESPLPAEKKQAKPRTRRAALHRLKRAGQKLKYGAEQSWVLLLLVSAVLLLLPFCCATRARRGMPLGRD